MVRNAVRGVDCVCHLAAINGTEFFYSMPQLVLEVAVKGMINVLDACIESGVPELLLMSSSEVYQQPPQIPTPETVPLIVPDPHNPRYSYGAGKIISEVLAINYGRKDFDRVLIVRPHNVYGPDMGWEHVIPQFCIRMGAIETKPGCRMPFPLQGDGTQTRSFLYVSDMAKGVAQILERGTHLEIYHLGSEDEIAIEDLAARVAVLYGKEVEVRAGEKPQGGPSRRCPNTAKARQLGFLPVVTLDEGLKRTAEWYDSHGEDHRIKRTG